MSSEGYLGAFQEEDKVTLILDKEMVTTMLNYMTEEEDIEITDEQMKEIVKKIADSDLVGDFIERAWTIAENVVEEKK